MATRRRASAPRRDAYHHGDLAHQALDTSLTLLAEVGVEALSLREVARRIGVNHRALYRHYEDKRGLLVALSEQGHRALAAALAAAVQGNADTDANTAEQALIRIAIAYLRFARAHRARYELMFGPRLNEDGRYPALEAAILATIEPLRAELRRLGADATPQARRDAGVTLWSAVHGMTSLVLTQRIPLSDARLSAYVTTVMQPVVVGIAHTLRGR